MFPYLTLLSVIQDRNNREITSSGQCCPTCFLTCEYGPLQLVCSVVDRAKWTRGRSNKINDALIKALPWVCVEMSKMIRTEDWSSNSAKTKLVFRGQINIFCFPLGTNFRYVLTHAVEIMSKGSFPKFESYTMHF